MGDEADRAKAQVLATDRNGERIGSIEGRHAAGLASRGLAEIDAGEGAVRVLCPEEIARIKARETARIVHSVQRNAQAREGRVAHHRAEQWRRFEPLARGSAGAARPPGGLER